MPGLRTLPADGDTILALSSKLFAQDLVAAFNYSLPSISLEDFSNALMQRYAYATFDTRGAFTNLVGFVILEPENLKCSRVHYAFFKEYYEFAGQIGLEMWDHVQSLTGMHSIWGISPKAYRHNLAMEKAWHFVQGPVIQNACYFAKYQKFLPGLFYMRTYNGQCS